MPLLDIPTVKYALMIPTFPTSRHSNMVPIELRNPIPVVVRSKV